MTPSKIIFFMSGSIAAFKACQVISRLVQDGHEVQVVATPSTFNFVGRATLEGLTGKKVLQDLWESGHAMDHIHLTRGADFGILCPATANTLARLAHGFADDLVSAMALAWPAGKPFYIVPAMNHQMLEAAVTQENLQTLAARGFHIAATQSGALACGEEGSGRMLEVDAILEWLKPKPRLGKLLITAGATREPIDGIRYISNVSTGQTASTLSNHLHKLGWAVTFLHGQGSAQPQHAQMRSFTDFKDLDAQLRAELGAEDYHGVIHCAAVSDYSAVTPSPERKISSTAEQLNVALKLNFKILPRLKEYSRDKSIRVIGFKLTLNDSSSERLLAAEALLSPSVDAVVVNEWGQVTEDRSRHPCTLITRTDSPRPCQDLSELSRLLQPLLVPAFKGEKNGPVS